MFTPRLTRNSFTALARRMEAVELAEVVDHRNLVLPQLGATGVAAHEVKRATGFSVRYGPVRARDIGAFLAAGMKATPEMRRVTFGWKARLVLAPMELSQTLKPALLILAALTALYALRHRTVGWHVAADFVPFLAAIFAGGVLTPLLLPWLPTRFAVKGAIAGALCIAAALAALPGGVIEVEVGTDYSVSMTGPVTPIFDGELEEETLDVGPEPRRKDNK